MGDSVRFDLIWPEGVTRLKEEIVRIRQGQNLIRCIIHIKHKDGFYKGLQIWDSVFERTNNKVTMYTVYTADDTTVPGNIRQ